MGGNNYYGSGSGSAQTPKPSGGLDQGKAVDFILLLRNFCYVRKCVSLERDQETMDMEHPWQKENLHQVVGLMRLRNVVLLGDWVGSSLLKFSFLVGSISPLVCLSHTHKGKIFVGGLSWQTTEESLRWHFEQYGTYILNVLVYTKYGLY